MEQVEGKWGRLWGWCGLGRRCRCGCCTYRLREQYCGLCTGWSRGGQKGKISWWIVTPSLNQALINSFPFVARSPCPSPTARDLWVVCINSIILANIKSLEVHCRCCFMSWQPTNFWLSFLGFQVMCTKSCALSHASSWEVLFGRKVTAQVMPQKRWMTSSQYHCQKTIICCQKTVRHFILRKIKWSWND